MRELLSGMRPRGVYVLSAGLVAMLTGCFTEGIGRDCGEGTSLQQGVCSTTQVCGRGTVLRSEECEATSGAVECEGNLVLNEEGSACVLLEAACEAPSMLDTVTGRCVGPEDIQCGAGTELLNGICVPSCVGRFEVPNARRNGCVAAARLQFLHASPDPVLATVDVYADRRILENEAGESIGQDFEFGRATPVLKAGPSASFSFSVSTAESSDGNEPLVELGTTDIVAGMSYLVVLRGVADTSLFDDTVNGASTIELELAAYSDLLEGPSSEVPRFAFVHAVTDAPTVDVVRNAEPSEVLFDDVSYAQPRSLVYSGDVSDSLPGLEPGFYRIVGAESDGGAFVAVFLTSAS